jgi:hypothetical protein
MRGGLSFGQLAAIWSLPVKHRRQVETMIGDSSSVSTPDLIRPSRPAPFEIFPFSPLPAGLITRVDAPKCYSFYGNFDQEFLIQSTREFLSSYTDASGPALSKALSTFFSVAYSDCISLSSPENAASIGQACWVVIRMGHETDEYVTPRWHQDGRMFDCSCVEPKLPHSKYAISLLGPATLILNPSDSMIETYSSVEYRWEDDKRQELAEKLAGFERYAIRTGEAIRFSWGQDDSPVHSEPNSEKEDRVFMSILFGSERELRMMCEWREEEYGKVSS